MKIALSPEKVTSFVEEHVAAGRTVTFGPMTKHEEGKEPVVVLYVQVREPDAFPTFGQHVEDGDGTTVADAVAEALLSRMA